MSKKSSFAARKVHFLNRWHAARAGRMKARAVGFVSSPEPRTIGSFARGRQLLAGNFLFAGHLVERKDADVWDLSPPTTDFELEQHGFQWLDDLAAVGDGAGHVRRSLCSACGAGAGSGPARRR